jgi:hypothetical protein
MFSFTSPKLYSNLICIRENCSHQQYSNAFSFITNATCNRTVQDAKFYMKQLL